METKINSHPHPGSPKNSKPSQISKTQLQTCMNLLCKSLYCLGVEMDSEGGRTIPLSAEVFRSAKFNNSDPNLMRLLWRLTHHLCLLRVHGEDIQLSRVPSSSLAALWRAPYHYQSCCRFITLVLRRFECPLASAFHNPDQVQSRLLLLVLGWLFDSVDVFGLWLAIVDHEIQTNPLLPPYHRNTMSLSINFDSFYQLEAPSISLPEGG